MKKLSSRDFLHLLPRGSGATPSLSDRMTRRKCITLISGVAVAWSFAARAQQSVPVVGILMIGSPQPYAHLTDAFRRGLGETGYVDRQNVAIEYRWAENHPDRVPELAADLVRRRVDVIVVATTAAAHVVKGATTAIPLVFGVGDDPTRTGLVARFSHPGGNATGVNFFASNLGAKRLGLLRELVPQARRVAVLINRSTLLAQIVGGDSSIDVAVEKDAQASASGLGLAIDVLHAGNIQEIDEAFATIVQKHADALLVSPDPLFTTRRSRLVDLAARYVIPAIYPQREYAEVGGLMSYGTSLADAYHQMGTYAGRILKGEKPADLPVMQSTRLELVINTKAAKGLALSIPPRLFALADEVVE